VLCRVALGALRPLRFPLYGFLHVVGHRGSPVVSRANRQTKRTADARVRSHQRPLNGSAARRGSAASLSPGSSFHSIVRDPLRVAKHSFQILRGRPNAGVSSRPSLPLASKSACSYLVYLPLPDGYLTAPAKNRHATPVSCGPFERLQLETLNGTGTGGPDHVG